MNGVSESDLNLPPISSNENGVVQQYFSNLNGTGEFDLLINEIESSGGSCANVIRKLCELEKTSSELLGNFLEQLDVGMSRRDEEIERMCNHHYQGFVDSIQELMKVREDAESLRGRLRSTEDAVVDTVKMIHTRCEELAKCQDTLNNCDKAIEALQVCLPILEQYAHVLKNIEAKRFYPALRGLEYLEHSQIPLISSYAFADTLTCQIPLLRTDIKTSSLSELTDFLENIRKHSVRLGAVAMKQTAKKTGMDPGGLIGGNVKPNSTFIKQTGSKNYGKSRPAPAPPRPTNRSVNPFTGTIDTPDALSKELDELVSIPSDEEEDDGLSNVEDLVDLSTVYRCLHIHSVLGEKTEFEKHYRTQRKKQCQLSLSHSQAQQESLRNYCEFFSNVVGFFVVEDCIRHTVPTMVTRNYLDDLWSNTMTRLVAITRTNADKVEDSEVLLRLKDFCVLFGRTMQSLGFSVAGLKELTDQVWRRYQNVLATEWKERFQELFLRDDYTAIYLNVPDDYQLILDMYPCQTPEFDVMPYPKSLSFSMMVPRIFQAVKEYIDVCRRFTENLDLSQTELDDMVNKATNLLFSNSLNHCMTTAIRNSKENLLRLTQLSVNMDELEAACTRLEEYIQLVVTGVQPHWGAAEEVDAGPGGIRSGSRQGQQLAPRSRLHGISLFKDTRAEAESQIYATINWKVDQFLSLSNYEWMIDGGGEIVADPKDLTPTDCVVDLMSYLEGTFRCFTNLPPKVAQTACISSCKYISQSLDRLLLGTEVRCISEGALHQVSLDLSVCEDFAKREPVPGVESSTLLLTFQDLRQLLDVVIKDDWGTFFSKYYTPENKYDRVTPNSAIKLLEKLRESDKKKSSFFQSMQRKERDKRKRIDEILRQLRDLQANVYSK